MELSSHNWMRPEPIERILERLGQCGYDSIEISGEPEKFPASKVKPLLAKNKLTCYGAVTLMIAGRDMVSHDENVRKKSVQYVKDCIDFVKALDGRIVTVVPGEVGRIKSADGVDPDEEWKWGVAGMQECAKYAKERKITLGIEPLNRFETNFINNHKQALALANAAGDGVGVCLDAFHINIEEEDIYEAIKACKGRLTDFHVADTNRRPPGEGHHDWDKIIDTLKSIGYDGGLTNEAVIPADRTPVNRTTTDLKAMVGLDEPTIKFMVDHAMAVLTDEEYTKNTQATADYMRKYLGPKK